MAKLFFIKGSNTYINPMQIVSVYRTEQPHVAMSNGRDFILAEDEYIDIIALSAHEEHRKPEGKPDGKEELIKQLLSILKPEEKKED